MNGDLRLKPYFFAISFFIHFIVVLIIYFMPQESSKKTFLILGHYSTQPGYTFFKLFNPVNSTNNSVLASFSAVAVKPNSADVKQKKVEIKSTVKPKEVKTPKTVVEKEKKIVEKAKVKQQEKLKIEAVKKNEKKIELKEKETKNKVEKKAEIEKVINNQLKNNSDTASSLYSSNIPTNDLQLCLQREICKIWSAPIHVPKGTECSVRVVIDSKTGSIKLFEIIKKSEIPLYDMSIASIQFRKINIPKKLWGQEVTLVMRQ